MTMEDYDISQILLYIIYILIVIILCIWIFHLYNRINRLKIFTTYIIKKLEYFADSNNII